MMPLFRLVAADVFSTFSLNSSLHQYSSRKSGSRALLKSVREYPSAEILGCFYTSGYNKGRALEVILGVGLIIISNIHTT